MPFGELGDVINYKGEGTLNLVAYYPYAISTNEVVIPGTINDFTEIAQGKQINNIGDLEAPLKIYYELNSSSSLSPVQIITISLNNK